MPFVIRKQGTDEYLDEGANYGGLQTAYTYLTVESAQDERGPDEEVVEVALAIIRVVADP